jgi:hypothetical protein
VFDWITRVCFVCRELRFAIPATLIFCRVGSSTSLTTNWQHWKTLLFRAGFWEVDGCVKQAELAALKTMTDFPAFYKKSPLAYIMTFSVYGDSMGMIYEPFENFLRAFGARPFP